MTMISGYNCFDRNLAGLLKLDCERRLTRMPGQSVRLSRWTPGVGLSAFACSGVFDRLRPCQYWYPDELIWSQPGVLWDLTPPLSGSRYRLTMLCSPGGELRR